MIPYTYLLRTQNRLIPHVKFFEGDVSFKILSVLYVFICWVVQSFIQKQTERLWEYEYNNPMRIWLSYFNSCCLEQNSTNCDSVGCSAVGLET